MIVNRARIRRANELFFKQGVLQTMSLSIRYFVWMLCLPLVQRAPELYSHFLAVCRWIDGDGYTDADPLKLLWVDPARIEKWTVNEWPLERGRVRGGNWDRTDRWLMEKGGPAQIERELTDGTIEREDSEFHDLYVSMVEHGYLTQRELLTRDETRARSRNNELTPTVLNEVNVDVARDGELIWRTGGQHRLALAKLLGIDEIPVLVCKRHERWQAIRDYVRAHGELPAGAEGFAGHPDLADILDRFDQDDRSGREPAGERDAPASRPVVAPQQD